MDKNRLNIEDIIKRSLLDQKVLRKEYRLFGKLLYVQEPFVGDVDTQDAINYLEQNIPPHLFEEVDTIIVGTFDFLEIRDLEALYKDGAIYISNKIINSRDLLENILHEMAHSLEVAEGHYIYADGSLHTEFLGKRRRLKDLLLAQDTEILHDFSNTEYDLDFDMFLYQDIGYPKLRTLTNGLFYSPYSITSLREYWASGVENYYLGDREILKRVSPQLFIKIEGVITDEH
tara:strand:+ start:1659 stop:2351 length:693 start_codon:yes stop_codon:yes gene_type:complete